MSLSPAHRSELLGLARQSIAAALPTGVITPAPAAPCAAELLEARSAFVTLRVDHELRGCCGSLDAPRPLYEDVWRNAWAAAFADSRFAPLTTPEWPRADLHISVLTEPEPLLVTSEATLRAQLRPFVDGLVLELDGIRATFLPAVWEQLPDPERFLAQLKLKARWPADFWSPRIRVSRYTAEDFGEAE